MKNIWADERKFNTLIADLPPNYKLLWRVLWSAFHNIRESRNTHDLARIREAIQDYGWVFRDQKESSGWTYIKICEYLNLDREFFRIKIKESDLFPTLEEIEEKFNRIKTNKNYYSIIAIEQRIQKEKRKVLYEKCEGKNAKVIWKVGKFRKGLNLNRLLKYGNNQKIVDKKRRKPKEDCKSLLWHHRHNFDHYEPKYSKRYLRD